MSKRVKAHKKTTHGKAIIVNPHTKKGHAKKTKKHRVNVTEQYPGGDLGYGNE